MRLLGIILFLTVFNQSLFAQQNIVSNLSVIQEKGSVIVNYDLVVSSFIRLIILEDGKEKFGFRISGDVGYVESGTAKQIVLIPEKEIIVCHACVFRVVLDKSNLGEVIIGQQTWNVLNLNVSKFRNGDDIPEAKTAKEWERAGILGQPAWCYYDNDPNNGLNYGKLYNWFAVNDPRGLAPKGWHIPNYDEWEQLKNYLDGLEKSGIKKSFQSDFTKPGSITNNIDFSNNLGGGRFDDGLFKSLNNTSFWWTSSTVLDLLAWALFLDNSNMVYKYSSLKKNGFSVRCIKD